MPKRTPKPSVDSCRDCPQRQHSSWQSLSDAELAQIDRARRVVRCDQGDVLFEQGDAGVDVYCVRSGTVAVRRTDAEGNSVTLGLHYPGDLVGHDSVVAGSEHRAEAEAVQPSTLCVIEGEAVTGALARNPALAREMLRRSGAELDRARDALVRVATLSTRDRLLALLLDLMTRHGEAQPDGSVRLSLPLARRDLASMIGIRHETLSRLIARVEAEGLARFSGRQVVVPSRQALAAAVCRE